MAIPLWLRESCSRAVVAARRNCASSIRYDWENRLLFTEHHQSHAASAFFLAVHEAAILTMDGVGEWETTSVGFGRGNHLDMLKELHFPHSLACSIRRSPITPGSR